MLRERSTYFDAAALHDVPYAHGLVIRSRTDEVRAREPSHVRSINAGSSRNSTLFPPNSLRGGPPVGFIITGPQVSDAVAIRFETQMLSRLLLADVCDASAVL